MLAMPCNTAHYWYDDLVADVPTPFPHIADAVAAELPPQAQRVGIIATAATLAARIYEGRLDSGIEWLMPEPELYERPSSRPSMPSSAMPQSMAADSSRRSSKHCSSVARTA